MYIKMSIVIIAPSKLKTYFLFWAIVTVEKLMVAIITIMI